MKISSSIQEHYQCAINSTEQHDYIENVFDWVNKCSELKMIEELDKDILLVCTKVKKEDSNYVRMMFIVKDKVRGRIKTMGVTLKLVSTVEKLLGFFDNCVYKRYDNLIYIDILKKTL